MRRTCVPMYGSNREGSGCPYASEVPPLHIEVTPEDYEDGVAALLTAKFGDRGTVERDVRLRSRSGGRERQIDILIRFPLADLEEGMMVVDCKRYGTKVDIKDVEAFIGLVEDIGAPMRLLVTTEGFTSGKCRTGVDGSRDLSQNVAGDAPGRLRSDRWRGTRRLAHLRGLAKRNGARRMGALERGSP
jgi:hypothetical protein